MDKSERLKILDKLREDKHYYGEFGQKFLSNSNIEVLHNNPIKLREPKGPNPNFAIGGYFHTAILEPEKLCNFKIIDANSRNTNKYKEESGGEACVLKKEEDNLKIMIETMLDNNICRDLIRGSNIEYELPGIAEIKGAWWKGKADIINHDAKLIVDLKTTSNLKDFKWSAKKYNYDSQAYIYKKLFGYDMVFMAIDKKTHQIGLYDCSNRFYKDGEDKVSSAVGIYNLFYNTENFDPAQHLNTHTL